MSQQSLATAMRERGWRWSQATVWAVESGERPLRITEAADVVEILRPGRFYFVSELVRDSGWFGLTMHIYDANRLWGQAVETIVAFHRSQYALSAAYHAARESGIDVDGDVAAQIDTLLSPDIVYRAIEEARRQWAEEAPFADQSPPSEAEGVTEPDMSAFWEDVASMTKRRVELTKELDSLRSTKGGTTWTGPLVSQGPRDDDLERIRRLEEQIAEIDVALRYAEQVRGGVDVEHREAP